MKRILIFVLMLTGMFWQQDLCAQKATYQSVFIYNFTKYIKWPAEFADNKIQIAVLGNSDVFTSLHEMAEKKSHSAGIQLNVVKINSLDELSNCHVLFIPDRQSNKLDEVNEKTQGKNILIVTEKNGMAAQGAVINFIEEGGKLKFELNQEQAEKRGLKVSGSLISLAKIV
ncbi:MAG: YfiR family protein [Cyclobacteriaceae bacterium]|nr:YfiR family protein [Cyclobacteriaceae bacterium]